MYRQSKSVASNLGTRPSPRSLMLVVGCWQTCFSKPSFQQSGYKQDALCQPLWTRSALGTGKWMILSASYTYNVSHWCSLATFHALKLRRTKVYFPFQVLVGSFPSQTAGESDAYLCSEWVCGLWEPLANTRSKPPFSPRKPPASNEGSHSSQTLLHLRLI